MTLFKILTNGRVSYEGGDGNKIEFNSDGTYNSGSSDKSCKLKSIWLMRAEGQAFD